MRLGSALLLLAACVDPPGVQGTETKTPTPVEEPPEPKVDSGEEGDPIPEAARPATLELSLGNPSFEDILPDGTAEDWDGPGHVLMPDRASSLGPWHQDAVLELRIQALNDNFPIEQHTFSSVIGQARAGYTYEVSAEWVAPDEHILPAYIDIVFGDEPRLSFGQSADPWWAPVQVSRTALSVHEGQDVRVVIGATGTLGPANSEFMVWFDDVNVTARLTEP